MDRESLDIEQRGHVTVLRLAHGKANALDVELCEALTAQAQAHARAASRALVITGQGTIFSAGADLLRVLDGGADYVARFLPALCGLYEALYFHPKPVVTAINGHAIAGGCVLACVADRRLMAVEGGRIGLTELLVGVPLPTVALEIMRAVVTPHRFPSLVLGGATLMPPQALECGLVDELVAADQLLERAVAGAGSLAALPPAAFALAKRQLREPVRRRLDADGSRFDRAVLETWQAPVTLAAMRAYVERTLRRSRA